MAHFTVLSNGSIHLFFCDNKIGSNEYKRTIESEILPFIESHQKNDFFYQHDNATLPQKTLKCYRGSLSRQI